MTDDEERLVWAGFTSSSGRRWVRCLTCGTWSEAEGEKFHRGGCPEGDTP